MKGFEFWTNWLFAVSLLLVAMGAIMVFLNGTALFELANQQIDPAFWGAQEPPPTAVVFRQWVYGVWGATLFGLGITIAFVARHPFTRRELWAWNCLVAGVASWYILDTGLSIVYRVYPNAVLNTVLLVLIALPLGFTRREFVKV